MSDMLDKLAKERPNLLLGEVAALLHDVGKCHNDFIRKQVIDRNIPFDDNLAANPVQDIYLHPDVLVQFQAFRSHLNSGSRTLAKMLLATPPLWVNTENTHLVQQIKNEFLLRAAAQTPNKDPAKVLEDLKKIAQQSRGDVVLIGQLIGGITLFQLFQNSQTGMYSILPSLPTEPIEVLNGQYRLGEMLLLYPNVYQPSQSTQTDCAPWLLQADNKTPHQQFYALFLLGKCHGMAHVDKDITNQEGTRPKNQQAFVCTPFGATQDKITFQGKTDLTQIAANIPLAQYQDRKGFIAYFEKHFRFALGDTRIPINDVTLWDWSWAVAALYKSALAKYTIESAKLRNWPQLLTDLRWRTLCVTVDVLGLLAKAHRLSDLLGYKEAIEAGFEQVRKIIEETFPLGNRIYCDITGLYFTYPMFDKSDELAKEEATLVETIRNAMMKQCSELLPIVTIGPQPWGITDRWDKPSDKAVARAEAANMLATPHAASANLITSGVWQSRIDTQAIWQKALDTRHKHQHQIVGICPVCGLRPLTKQSDEYRERRCQDCSERAASSIAEWHDTGTMETPWLDEIADKHDRVALIVSRFQLDRWLDGTLIGTLPIVDPQSVTAPEMPDMKQPSPARIMRVWRTTEEFWKYSVCRKILAKEDPEIARKQKPRNPRSFRLQGDVLWKGATPQYEERVLDGTTEDGMPISLYHLGGGKYMTICNLELCSPKLRDRKPDEKIPIRVRNENGQWYTGEITATQEQHSLDWYQPTRTILTTPDQFLALVPAADALAIASNIAEQYACEMGKVRTRLPLDLALVYFHRKMPLYAVIDAARRFLTEKPSAEEKWTVRTATHPKTNKEGKVIEVDLSFLDEHQREVGEWHISTGFGDESQDSFYPYVARQSTAKDFDYEANKDQYIHVEKLEPGDVIKVAPSHFSYLWLDNSTRRYSIGAKDDDLPFSTQQVPLEEIAWHEQTWNSLKTVPKMTDTKLHGVIQLLLEKRTAWSNVPDYRETYSAFAADVLTRHGLDQKGIGITVEDVTSGRLFRCFDLHHRIMKVKLAPSKEEVSA